MLLCAFLMMSVMAFAQKVSIKGTVVDETNQPLPGASVSIDGTTLGATTDANGLYTITGVSAGNFTLTAKFIGYVAVKKTITVGSSVLTVDFGLKPESQNLNEVVVIGYGSARKKDLTGSVAQISAKDFNEGPVTTPEALITGKVSGVDIISNSGAPGAGSTIRIRGGASISASNDPLIVIDGVPISNAGIAGLDNQLASINPNDIESFTILKDASSTAIYGSRASNGVIMITTKKGKGGGKLNVNFNSVNSLSKITKEYPVLTAAQFRQAVNNPVANLTPAQQGEMGNASTDWQSQIYRQAISSDNNISFNGGIKGLPYRLSIGYLDQDGILKRDNLKRTTIDLNVNKDFLNKSLQLDLNVKGTYTDRLFANQGAIGSAVAFDPTQPVYSGNNNFGGYWEWLNQNGTVNTFAPKNPVGLLNETTGHGYSHRELGSISLTYTFPFLKELQANATFGGDMTDGMGNNFTDPASASVPTGVGAYSQYFTENYTYNADYYLKYSKDFKSINSHLDFQAGYSYQYFHFYTKPEISYAADKTTVESNPANSFPGQYYIESPYARLTYNFMEKYLLTATIRDDRSSRFSSANRNGYFPAIGLAWRVKEESFLKSVDFISDLKLRAGYGITGQQDIGPLFEYLATYDPSNIGAQYQFGNGFVNTLRADPYNFDIKWEQTATSNFGIDYGFLNGKINGSIDYYYKKTKDLLFDTPVADGTNLSNHVFANIGNMHSQGVEFNVNVVAVDTKDLKWNFGYNISFSKLVVDNISATKDPNQIIPTGGIPGGVGNTVELLKAGYAPYSFYVYQQVYGANGAPLEGVYVDRNNNGSTLDDKYLYQHPNPTIYMGFNTHLNYKQWGLGFTLRSNLGNYVYNAGQASNAAYAGLKFSGYLNNLPNSILKTNFQQYQLYSDYYVENASFLRMDNANLSYNFGKVARTANLKVYFNVENVFLITKYTGLDPEVANVQSNIVTGIDNNIYPHPRVFSIGLNLGF